MTSIVNHCGGLARRDGHDGILIFLHCRSNVDDLETENMNPEEIYNSIKKTSADIQNLSKLDSGYDDLKKERDTTSQVR